jgi:hypothetical protein
MDRFGVPCDKVCGAIIKNGKEDIGSHENKFHRWSSYAQKQAVNTAHPCDRPLRNSQGWCTKTPGNQQSLVTHAHNEHDFRGDSRHLDTPWIHLTNSQHAWYETRIVFERRRLPNGEFPEEDKARQKELKDERFPDA